MTDFTPCTTDRGNYWDINDAGGSREVEVDYEYPTDFGGNMTSYLFLSRADLVAMLAAIDSKDR